MTTKHLVPDAPAKNGAYPDVLASVETPSVERISEDEHAYLLTVRARLTAAEEARQEADEARQRADVEWGAAHAAATSFIHYLIGKVRLDKEAGDDLDLDTGIITRGARDA